jgi:hypothetical protein
MTTRIISRQRIGGVMKKKDQSGWVDNDRAISVERRT